MFKFDYLIYIILFLIAIVLFLHYRERISNKIIMTESYVDGISTNTESVIDGQLKKYNITYNDALKGYDYIANSYTNMKTQNNKLEPGSLADPSSYDQNFNTLKSKYDILSGDVAVKRDDIARSIAIVSKNYDDITREFNKDDEKNYVRNQIAAKKSSYVNKVAVNEREEILIDELKRLINSHVKRYIEQIKKFSNELYPTLTEVLININNNININ